jgi:hypothetical protein
MGFCGEEPGSDILAAESVCIPAVCTLLSQLRWHSGFRDFKMIDLA